MAENISKRTSSIFLATLGAEPQVVTAAVDLLQARGERLQQVHVFHTLSDQPALLQARTNLEVAFTQPPYQGFLPLLTIPLLAAPNQNSVSLGQPLLDIDTPQAGQAAFQTIYRHLRELKRQGLRLHFCIAGGRKSLALFSMACAQLLFDENDRLWYLISAGDFLASKRLHPLPGDQAHLLPIPLILWSQVSPILTGLDQEDDPYAAAEKARKLQLNQRLESARAFMLGALTPAERRVTECLLRSGGSDQEIAQALNLSPRTVEQHLRAAYTKAALHWDLPGVNRSQLIHLLSLYFTFTAQEV